MPDGDGGMDDAEPKEERDLVAVPSLAFLA